jgi:hypothetical protein
MFDDEEEFSVDADHGTWAGLHSGFHRRNE